MDSGFVGLDAYIIFWGELLKEKKSFFFFFFANFTKAYYIVNILLETLPG